MDSKEAAACTPAPVDPNGFNKFATLPYGVKVSHVRKAMEEFIDFLAFMNQQLNGRNLERLESFLMPASFSSMVGEFMGATIPKHCKSVFRNTYHNGHPDIVPFDAYPENSILHGPDGIEIKGSRYSSGWQGHNPEEVWLMVFVCACNSASDASKGIDPKPFKFNKVVLAKLLHSDWSHAGRKEGSRRTITASVNKSGYAKLEANWIYRAL